MTKFKVGDRVELRPGSEWNDGTPSNPINTGGTIIRASGVRYCWIVELDTGETYNCNNDDLILAVRQNK